MTGASLAALECSSGAYYRSFAAASYPALWHRVYCGLQDGERHWCEAALHMPRLRPIAAAPLPAASLRRHASCPPCLPVVPRYEVVREGRPCHLYLDLEFPCGLNPGADGDALVDVLVDALAAQLRCDRHGGKRRRCDGGMCVFV